jgi:hypothetical protein
VLYIEQMSSIYFKNIAGKRGEQEWSIRTVFSSRISQNFNINKSLPCFHINLAWFFLALPLPAYIWRWTETAVRSEPLRKYWRKAGAIFLHYFCFSEEHHIIFHHFSK